MSNHIRTIVFIVATLIIVGGIGYYNIKRDSASSINTDILGSIESGDKETEDDITVTNDKLPDDTEIKNGEAEDEKMPIAGATRAVPAISVPDLDHPIIFFGGYSAEKMKEITGQIAILTDTLKADNNRFNEWMDLGMLRKSIEDYEGAREAWEYASAIRPVNSLSFVNLGMLYGYYLHQPVKAEANLLHAIENEPRFLDFYRRMVDFYIEVMNDKGKAVDFLDRAIQKYPEWIELQDLRIYITK